MLKTNVKWTEDENAILKEHGQNFLNTELKQKFLPHRSHRAIQEQCRSLNIKKTKETRSSINRKFFIIDEKEFTRLYAEKSLDDLSQIYKVNRSVISNYARKIGVPLKKQQYKNIDIEFTQRQKEIIDGTLLGDAYLSKIKGNSNSSLGMTHCLKQEGFLLWKHKELAPFSAKISYTESFSPKTQNGLIIGRNLDKINKNVSFNTIRHPFITNLEKKWYARDDQGDYIFNNIGRRIKIIPKDLILTPLSLAIWYFDDGSNHITYNKYCDTYSSSVILYTLSFSQDECEFLINQVKSLGIENCYIKNSKKRKDQFKIIIGQPSYKKFIDIITPHLPHECMAYKVNSYGYNYNVDKYANTPPKFIEFEEAVNFVRTLDIEQTKKSWRRYAKSNQKPSNIPSTPENVYKEWKGWNYWFGDFWMDYNEAKNFALNLNLKSKTYWNKAYEKGLIPTNIPQSVDRVYAEKWESWGVFLGTGNVRPIDRIFMSFDEAREFTHNLKLKSKSQWYEYVKNGNKPNNIPSTPPMTYKKNWKGWEDWLGTIGLSQSEKYNNFILFNEARIITIQLGLKSRNQWWEYCKSGNKSNDIPSRPDTVYKKDWKGWTHWLGK